MEVLHFMFSIHLTKKQNKLCVIFVIHASSGIPSAKVQKSEETKLKPSSETVSGLN